MFYKIIVEASGVEIDTREELEEQHTHTHTRVCRGDQILFRSEFWWTTDA